MRFITVRDIRTSPATIWRELPEAQEMIITNNGKPIALLTPLTGETLEETVTAIRRARAANAVRSMRRIAEDRGLAAMTGEDIQAEIDASRRDRQR